MHGDSPRSQRRRALSLRSGRAQPGGPPVGHRASGEARELTEWGLELEPVLDALGRWGARAPLSPPEVGMSFDDSVRAQDPVRPDLAKGFGAKLELRLGEHRFRAGVADGQLELVRGEATAPDAILETDAGTLIALAHRRLELDQAVRAGHVAIEGDTQAVERFVGLFTLPEPFAAAV